MAALAYFKTDIMKIEIVSRRFTKAIFPQLLYSERLHLPTLEMRWIMTDLTTCYKQTV